MSYFVQDPNSSRLLSVASYQEFIETREPTTVANIAICLINQAKHLLDKQIARLEADFVTKG